MYVGQNSSSDSLYDSNVLMRAEQRVSGTSQQRRSDVISDWAMPANKEERQLGQQIALMKAEPSIKMNAMKAAGINPLTAASGISGSGSTSIPQPAASTNPIGDVAGAVGNVAGAFNSVAAGVSTLSKLGDEIENIRSDSKSKLAAAGLDEATTEGVLTDNTYKDEDWQTKLNVQRQQFENMKAEYQNLLKTHEEISKHIDEMQSQIELNGSQQDYIDQMRLKVEEETRWMKVQNEWRESHKLYITDSGIDGYIFSMVASGADLSDFDRFVQVYSDYRKSVSYAETRGLRDAEVETAFDKAFNEALGNQDVAAQFAPYMAQLDVVKSAMMDLYKAVIENPRNPIAAITKMVNLISLLGGAYDLGKHEISNSTHKPNIAPKK